VYVPGAQLVHCVALLLPVLLLEKVPAVQFVQT
jgi:hypothetical protein